MLLLDADTTRRTPARRAASSTVSVPWVLDRSVMSGVSTDLATEPRAAWWKMTSTPSTAWATSSSSQMSPSKNSASAGQVLGEAGGEVVEDADLVALLSSSSARFDPMNPAPPVTSVNMVETLPVVSESVTIHGRPVRCGPWHPLRARRFVAVVATALALVVGLTGLGGCSRSEFEDRTAVVVLDGSRETYEVQACGLDGQTVFVVAEAPGGAVLQGVMGLEDDDKTGVPASTGLTVDLDPTSTETPRGAGSGPRPGNAGARAARRLGPSRRPGSGAAGSSTRAPWFPSMLRIDRCPMATRWSSRSTPAATRSRSSEAPQGPIPRRGATRRLGRIDEPPVPPAHHPWSSTA